MILALLEHVVQQVLFPRGRCPTARKVERHRSTLFHAHGPFSAGTPCWVSRARPDAFLFLELDDGSVIEISPGYGFALEEFPSTYRLFDLARKVHVLIDLSLEEYLLEE